MNARPAEPARPPAVAEPVPQPKPDDPSALPPAEQRRREIAAILAAGILRLRARAALPAAPGPQKEDENAPN